MAAIASLSAQYSPRILTMPGIAAWQGGQVSPQNSNTTTLPLRSSAFSSGPITWLPRVMPSMVMSSVVLSSAWVRVVRVSRTATATSGAVSLSRRVMVGLRRDLLVAGYILGAIKRPTAR